MSESPRRVHRIATLRHVDVRRRAERPYHACRFGALAVWTTHRPSSVRLCAVTAARVILIESGGDNLAATFSPELADLTIYAIDVSASDKIPRKGGPGITRNDLLVINKTDLAPLVGASLEVMDRDSRRMRGERPFVFADIRAGQGVAEVAAFVKRAGGLGQ